jgi:chromosome partitioning protein
MPGSFFSSYFPEGLICEIKSVFCIQKAFMRIIVVANQKGGCAKTTTVVNLACSLALHGKRVLVIDLDPQGNSSQWLNANGAENGSFLLLTGKEPIENLIGSTVENNVKIISASKELSQIEKMLAGELAVEGTLKRRLKKLNPDDWDFILIDTPPTLGLLTINACVAAKELLVPVTTHVMTLSGVSQLIARYQEITEMLNPDLEILGFLASRVDLRTRHSKDVLESLRERFGDKVFKTIIRENVFLAEAPSFKMSILEYKSKSSAANDYRSLAEEVLNA